MARHRVRDGEEAGIVFYGDGTKGRLEGCEIARNKGANLEICFGADPSVVGCKYVLTGEHDRAYHAICTLHLSDLFPLHLFKCRRSLSPPPYPLSIYHRYGTAGCSTG